MNGIDPKVDDGDLWPDEAESGAEGIRKMYTLASYTNLQGTEKQDLVSRPRNDGIDADDSCSSSHEEICHSVIISMASKEVHTPMFKSGTSNPRQRHLPFQNSSTGSKGVLASISDDNS